MDEKRPTPETFEVYIEKDATKLRFKFEKEQDKASFPKEKFWPYYESFIGGAFTEFRKWFLKYDPSWWLRVVADRYPLLRFVLNDLQIYQILGEVIDIGKNFVSEIISKGESILRDKILSYPRNAWYKIRYKNKIKAKEGKPGELSMTEIEESEVSEGGVIGGEFDVPEDDPLNARFRKLVFELGEIIHPHLGEHSKENNYSHIPSLVPVDYFRENGWVVTFRFPQSFFNFLKEREINKNIWVSEDMLGLNPKLYGFNSVSALLTSLLLSCSVRTITIPSRIIEFDSFSGGHPITLSVPLSVREDEWPTITCEFFEIAKWDFPNDIYETLPAHLLFKLYLDFVSGLGETSFSLRWEERHKRMPLPGINSSILITVYLFRFLRVWDTSDVPHELVEKNEIKRLFSRPWVFKILAIPSRVNIDASLKYSSGNPITSSVEFKVLFYHSFTSMRGRESEMVGVEGGE